MRKATILTIDQKDKFLRKLASGYSISASAKAAGVHRQSYYDWRESDPEFAIAADHALESGTDTIEDIALSHARQGNASLITLLLKSRRPDKYKDRSEQQHTGKDGDPLKIVIERIAS